jgi:hypothetical protein
VHVGLGAAPSLGLFVTGLPGPLPAATDTVALLVARPLTAAALGTAALLVIRVLPLLALIWAASPIRDRTGSAESAGSASARSHFRFRTRTLLRRVAPALGISAGAGPLALALGILFGAGAAALVAGLATVAWLGPVAAAGRRRPRWPTWVAGGLAWAAAVVLTPAGAPAGPAPIGDAVVAAALGGAEGSIMLLAALLTARPMTGAPRAGARARVRARA